MTSTNERNYCELATQYCRDIVAGNILACESVKQACQRQLNDLDKQDTPEFPYYFSEEHGNRICRFAEKLPHVTGRAFFRKRLKLEPWQCWLFTTVYGWLKRKDNLRRFREAYVFVPKKNGKTFLSSIVGLYGLRYDQEPGAEVYVGASGERQANLLFGTAQKIVLNSPGLRAKGIQVLAHAITHPSSGSRMETVIGQPKDGQNGSTLCLDEAHEWPNDLLLTNLQSGTVSRLQPLTFITTTAGYNLASPAKFLQDELNDILTGQVVNDEIFGVVYTSDIDWRDDRALRMANPNFGVSVMEDSLQSERTKALNSPRLQSAFKTKHLNIWTNASETWIDGDKWDDCADPTMKLEDFAGQPVWEGLDAASRQDLTAYIQIFRKVINEESHYYLFSRFYLPAAQIDMIENSHYRQWVGRGFMYSVPGFTNDHALLKEHILEDAKRFQLQHLAYDPYGIFDLTSTLAQAGLKMVETLQRWQYQSTPMKELESLVLSKRLHHDGNPVMGWCISNTMLKHLRNNVIAPTKESTSTTKKIDGTVAAIMALRPCLLAPLEAPKKRSRFFTV